MLTGTHPDLGELLPQDVPRGLRQGPGEMRPLVPDRRGKNDCAHPCSRPLTMTAMPEIRLHDGLHGCSR